MLHLFNVNQGSIMAFDVNLAMEKLDALKSSVYEEHGIHPDKQVMLIQDGKALNNDDRVCNYSTGTETNPLYLFDKSAIGKPDMQIQTDDEFPDFRDMVEDALSWQPTYNTVTERTKLALRMHQAAKKQVSMMGSLVHDQHLMCNGWKAAVKNLLETAESFKTRLEMVSTHCSVHLQKKSKCEDIFEGLNEVLDELSRIKLFTSDTKQLIENKNASQNFNKSRETLLDWIEQNCNNISLKKLCDDTAQKLVYLTPDKLELLKSEARNVLGQAHDPQMCEISGMDERLAALNQVITAADKQVNELAGIVQGFVRNQETAHELQANSVNRDALLTICESHTGHLRIIQEYELSTHDAVKKCANAKQELATNLHTRLRWVYYIERSILNVDVKLCLFHQHLSQMQHQILFFEQLKEAPSVYIKSVVEARRRAQFSKFYMQWSNNAISASQILCKQENEKRKEFQPQVSQHFLRKLLRGFSDLPIPISTNLLPPLDARIIMLSDAQVLEIANALPVYREILSVPVAQLDLSMLQQFNLGQSLSIIASSTTHTVTSTNIKMTSIDSQTTLSDVTSMSVSDVNSSSAQKINILPQDVATSPTSSAQPGGFVLSSVTNVEKAMSSVGNPHSSELPQNQKENVNVEPITDIISPESPPNSDFFSIQPGSIDLPDYNQAIHKKEDSFMKGTSKYYAVESKHLKSPIACSPDSVSTASFHKVEGITSSDEEMFHSFTSESSRELKLLRKRVQHLLGEYDNLSEDKRKEEQEKNKTIKKLTDELESERNTRSGIELDFQRRWDATKADLDDVIRQLESEKVERKNAWELQAKLEREIQAEQKKCETQKVEYDGIIKSKQSEIESLRNLCFENGNRINLLQEENRTLERKHSLTIEKHYKDVQLLQNEVKDADDRIQELESALSASEVETAASKMEVYELRNQCNKTQDSLQQTVKGNDLANERNMILEEENKDLQKTIVEQVEKVKNLKHFLADYESKMLDSKVTTEQLMAIQATLQRTQESRSELENLLNDSSHQNKLLENKNNNLEIEVKNLSDTIENIQKNHMQQIEDINQEHATESKETCDHHKEIIADMEQKHLSIIEQHFVNFEEEKANMESEHRSQLDEVEADRLQCIAQTQQNVEFWMNKDKECSRNLDIMRSDRDELLEKVQSLTTQCEEFNRLTMEHQEMVVKCHDLESELWSVRESLERERSLRDNNGNLMYASSVTTSSNSDEESSTKRKRLDGNDNIPSISSNDAMEDDNGSMPLPEHKEIIRSMQKNFDHDKKSIQTMFEKRTQEMQRKFQLSFNSAMRKLQETKDAEINRLKEDAISKSMFVRPSPSMRNEGSPIDIPCPVTTQPFSEDDVPAAMAMSGMTESVTTSKAPPSSSSKDQDFVVISNFQPGDTVLISYSSAYSSHTLFTSSKTLYFVHEESLKSLGLKNATEVKRKTVLAVFGEKEYCQAKKPQNRFNVPVNMKFYRVKLQPFMRESRRHTHSPDS